ncbi:MAG: hypothetical protein IT479_03185 [Xanthomonadales bacterium]|nr:hypothetical protein [Xanthomonadales bacterium]
MTHAATLRRARLALLGTTVLYAAAHLAWYGGTPLGGFPVLDGREMLELARAIASGELAREPFYRAPLYPALLAIFIRLGVPDGLLPDAARLLNLVAHLSSCLLVFELARRTWADLRAGLLAGLLYACYPVALHFAGDPLDITLATALALAATLCAWNSACSLSAAQAWAAASLYALAALARPNFLMCIPALLLWLAWIGSHERGAWRLLPAAATGAMCVLLVMGGVNRAVGGEFRWLPWQGSHGLWDANGPGANGLFYSHSVAIPDLAPGSNPARAEAEILYCRDRPCSGPIDIDEFSAYWSGRMREHAMTHPREVLGILAGKVWYLVNNYEQYNNKTYWFHKARAPWLRWNPLCWALLLALAAGALWLPMQARARALLLLVIGAYATSLLLYFVSARFRLPLAPLLCVLSGGWMPLLARWRNAPSMAVRRLSGALATAAAVALVAGIPAPTHLREGTVVEDWVLLASASLHAGDWRAAEDWARKVIARTPRRTAAEALICAARLHAWEDAPTADRPPRVWLEESLSWCAASARGSHRAAYNSAFFLAGLCRHAEAHRVWLGLRDSRLIGELARNALAATVGTPLDAGDKVDGLLRIRQSEGEIQKPGLLSLWRAVQGNDCANVVPGSRSG